MKCSGRAKVPRSCSPRGWFGRANAVWSGQNYLDNEAIETEETVWQFHVFFLTKNLFVPMARQPDVIVAGLGAVGSAALYQLARRGVRAMGLDRFHPSHDRGSTHGESRITRLALGEGGQYAQFARRSHEIP